MVVSKEWNSVDDSAFLRAALLVSVSAENLVFRRVDYSVRMSAACLVAWRGEMSAERSDSSTVDWMETIVVVEKVVGMAHYLVVG